MNKDEFIHRVAEKAGFTLGDTKWFLNGMIAVLAEAIQNEEEARIRGFGRLHFRKMKPRKGYNPATKQSEEFGESTVIQFTVSQKLRDLLRLPDRKKCRTSQEYRDNLAKYLEEQGIDEDE